MPSNPLTLNDVDISCGAGWIPVIERLIDDLNAAHVRLFDLATREAHGRLRLHYTAMGEHIFGDAGLIVVRAEFASMYVCEVCGAPGEYRRGEYGCLSTRCVEHQSPDAKAGERRYNEHRRPYRRMTKGDFEYDPVADVMVRMSGRLQVRTPEVFAEEPHIELDPDAEAVVDEGLRLLWRMPFAADYRIKAIYRYADGHLLIDDNLDDLPPGAGRDLLRAKSTDVADRVAKLPMSSRH